MSTGESEKISLFRDIKGEGTGKVKGGGLPRNVHHTSWEEMYRSLASGEEKGDLPGPCRGRHPARLPVALATNRRNRTQRTAT